MKRTTEWTDAYRKYVAGHTKAHLVKELESFVLQSNRQQARIDELEAQVAELQNMVAATHTDARHADIRHYFS